MKTYKDKATGNMLSTKNPFVQAQYDARPERYVVVSGNAKPEAVGTKKADGEARAKVEGK